MKAWRTTHLSALTLIVLALAAAAQTAADVLRPQPPMAPVCIERDPLTGGCLRIIRVRL